MISPLPIAAGEQALRALPALRSLLHDEGPLLLPYAADDAAPAGAVGTTPPGAGLAVGTSGSTGTAKRALLSPAALRASTQATHDRLGGPGRWLLALPGHHIAGLQVLLRSLTAGLTPTAVPDGPFTAAGFSAAVQAMPGPRRYSSLVPTQLRRVLADDAGRDALAALDGILVGGAATPPDLVARARQAGAHVVLTYGMSETAGGCVYDGVPLHGVNLAFDDGRIRIAGPVLAGGYLGDAGAEAFVDIDGRRWFRTDDLGHLDEHDSLVVDGRADDVVVTGGLKVWPGEVEQALRPLLPAGSEVVVLGVPDAQWGQTVAAVIAPGDGVDEGVLLQAARSVLPRHAVPRRLMTAAQIPQRGPGKPDRRGLLELLTGDESKPL